MEGPEISHLHGYQALPGQHDVEDAFIQDGSVDYRSRPVIRARSGGWRASIFIIGYELIERLAYYGVASNLVIYLREELHLGTTSATQNVNIWSGVTTILPIIGAFIADAYWGRYWSITYLSTFYVLGMILLTVSASVKSLTPASCTSDNVCPEASSVQLAFCFISLYLIAIGTGGVKPCLEAFGADQFDEEDEVERKSKSSFFNWWYFGLCTGALLAFTVIVYVEDNASWGLGFGILALLITVALLLFLVGTPLYRNKVPAGSPLVGIFQVFVAAVRKWNIEFSDDISSLYDAYDKVSSHMGRRKLKHTPGLRCLDKAAIKGGVLEEDSKLVENFESTIDPWKLCTVTQVEEAKLIVRIFPIWMTTIIYGLVIAQATTLFVEQAATLDRSVGSLFTIPSASLLTFSSLTVLIVLPIYDRVFVPLARKLTGCERGLTLLQRLGVGILLSVACMVVAALVEKHRLKVIEEYELVDNPTTTIPMGIAWLLPQYVILGVSDVFALVGQQEFFYDQVPDTMRSLGMSLYLCANGLGSILSSVLISIVNYFSSRGGGQAWIVDNLNKCHLDYYYWLLAALCTLNVGVYLALALSYTYKTVESSPKEVMSSFKEG